MNQENDDPTRPITLPPREQPRCVKDVESPCDFRSEEGFCEKRFTTCRWRVPGVISNP